MKIRRSQQHSQTKPGPGSAPAGKQPRIPASYSIRNEPAAGRSLPLRFTALAMVLLAGSALCLFFLAQCLIRPSAQIGSLAALPAYNMVGEQNDQASFWSMAKYHDLPPTSSDDHPFFALDALNRLNSRDHLTQLMQPDGMCSLIAAEGALVSSWTYDDLLQEVRCWFVDDIPCTYSDSTGREIPGSVDLSMGWSTGFSCLPVCYTVLFHPQQNAGEEAFEKAYASLVDDLQQLCGARIDRFVSIETMLLTLGTAPFENAGMTFESACALSDLGIYMGQTLEQLYTSATFPYDLDDPERATDLLQEHFSSQGLSLQILRLEEFYLVLIGDSSSTLGLYYSPVLETWCGFGLQQL